MIRFVGAVAALVLVGPACGNGSGCGANVDCAAHATPSVLVFAASSLKPAFDRMIHAEGEPLHLSYNYAGSQTLASQITQGAHADVFASADTQHMSQLVTAGFVAGQAQVFAHNRLEIAVERGNPKGIHTLADLARPGLIVVLADPSVPAGKYAQQALAGAGVKIKPASLELQVTAVLSKVELGEADAGIVYVSDVVTSGKVDGVTIPDAQNVIADYPIAAIKGGDNGPASKFIALVMSAQGQAILVQAGFEKA